MAVFKQTYLMAVFVMLALFALLAFVPFGSSANPVAVMKTMDAGHAFAFILLSGLFYLAVEPYGEWRAIVFSMVISVLLIVAVELVQPYVGRTASFADVQMGLLGVFLALSGIIVWRRQSRQLFKVVHLLLLVLTLVWVVQPALSEWRAVWLRDQQFPVLGGFESDLEKRLWKAHGIGTSTSFSGKHVVVGSKSLKTKTTDSTWSGVRYSAGDQDWRGYQFLNIELYNAGKPFKLNIRIDDGVSNSPDYGDRYDGQYQVNVGANTLLIPLADVASGPKSRLLDLGKVRKMILFLSRKEMRREFYLDDIRLIP
ncbi:hypothetical protein MNBD_GAMMA17-2251 [hydrothermal vent metagenome]|uniref:CBM11 domain-containing protein n=1 Tax=hydrothermal vent metagenome TaxID=652676 RepID=A0A3B0ZM64_9ZZZZ